MKCPKCGHDKGMFEKTCPYCLTLEKRAAGMKKLKLVIEDVTEQTPLLQPVARQAPPPGGTSGLTIPAAPHQDLTPIPGAARPPMPRPAAPPAPPAPPRDPNEVVITSRNTYATGYQGNVEKRSRWREVVGWTLIPVVLLLGYYIMMNKYPGEITFIRSMAGKNAVFVSKPDGMKSHQITGNDLVCQDPCLSPDGTKVVYSSTKKEITTLWFANADGSSPEQIKSSGGMNHPIWSSDGSQLVVKRIEGAHDEFSCLYVYDVKKGHFKGLASQDHHAENPSFSPDGTMVVYQTPDGIKQVTIKNNQVTQLTKNGRENEKGDKDKLRTVADVDKASAGDAATGDKKDSAGSIDTCPRYHPSGNKIGFIRDGHIFVMSASGKDQREYYAKIEGIEYFTWSPNGSDLCFSTEDGTLYVTFFFQKLLTRVGQGRDPNWTEK